MRVLLVGMIALVAAFAATWVTLPTQSPARVKPPASFFAVGGLADVIYREQCVSGSWTEPYDHGSGVPYRDHVCEEYERVTDGSADVDVTSLRRRVVTLFGASAAVVLLAGAALGARVRPR